uniref:site-specific integrase n=1 Tax=Pseudomonas sp. TaxID=306 RepID=UPI0010B1AF6A|nr:site-specific integrase [Pseudomonas sp.]QBM91835.1 Integrase [Pseudomonas sp.]
MARFSSPERQAERISRHLHRTGVVASIRTANGYSGALKLYAQWLSEQGIQLENGSREQALQYLDQRSEQVGQSALNLDRQAIDTYRSTYQNQTDKLPVLKSEETHALKSRAYSQEQIQAIIVRQTEPYQLATAICAGAGLRAHELFTLCKGITEQPPSARDWDAIRHARARGYIYTVVGKGGLVRTVKIPYVLADKLETLKLAIPRTVTDRGIRYEQRYAIPGGNKVSASFTSASQRALGWSRGVHGLRHTYAQERLKVLAATTQDYDRALRVVSHELGHLRPDITLIYLR